MSDLERAVDARIDAFRPEHVPAFDDVVRRGRAARRRRRTAGVALPALTACAVAALVWPPGTGSDRLDQAGPRGAGDPRAALFSVHRVLDAAPYGAATGPIAAPALDTAADFPSGYSCPAASPRPLPSPVGGGVVVCTDLRLPEVLRLGPPALTGADVEDALGRPDGASPVEGLGEVRVTFTDAGSRAFQQLTAEAACAPAGSAGRQLAFVVDGTVLSTVGVADSVGCGDGIDGGSTILISPSLDVAGAEELARRLSAR